MIQTYAIAYVATAIVFFGADFIWLSRMTSAFYRPRMGSLLLDQPNLAAAGLFYLVYVAGVVHLAVVPAVNSGSWTTALVSGAILGLVAYGTYDMTNLATLKNWSLSLSAVDMAWGTVLTAVAASGGYLAVSWLVARAG